MELGDVTVDINANMWFDEIFDDPFASTSSTIVCIDFIHNFQRLNMDESDGTVFYNGPLLPPICVELFSYEFSPDNLFKVVDSHIHDPLLSRPIAETVASQASQNVWFPQRYLIDVNVVFMQAVFFQEEESTCAICLENLRNDETTKSLLYCSHQFHETCISQWLVKRNACPLCRATVDNLFDKPSCSKFEFVRGSNC